MQPLALDLYCCAGGVCKGLQDAGFRVVGVDIDDQPDYPSDFVRADALRPPFRLDYFDFVWASPPCQTYSTASNAARSLGVASELDLVADTRRLLQGHPMTCIENVPNAPLNANLSLSGDDFGNWDLRRKRIFELSFDCLPPMFNAPPRPKDVLTSVSAAGHGSPDRAFVERRKARGLSGTCSIDELEAALGIYHIRSGTAGQRRHRLNQAIPPVYSEWIGKAAMEHLQR